MAGFLQAPKFYPVNSHYSITPYKSITTNSRYIKFRWDSSVGIATRYGLGGPGIEFRWRRDFPHLSTTALDPTQPPIQWIPGLSGGKGVDHPPASSAEVKERVEIYLYSPSGPSWLVSGWTLHFMNYIAWHCSSTTETHSRLYRKPDNWKIETDTPDLLQRNLRSMLTWLKYTKDCNFQGHGTMWFYKWLPEVWTNFMSPSSECKVEVSWT